MSLRKRNPALCWLVLFFLPGLSFSQELTSKKFSPTLLARPSSYFADSLTPRKYILNVRDTKQTVVELKKIGKDIRYFRILNDELLLVQTTPLTVKRTIAALTGVDFIDEQSIIPIEEEGVSSHDFSVNAIYAAHHFFPGINGKNQVVSVKENRMNPEDIDLQGRYLSSSFESPIGSTHATIMTTLISGAGNSFFKGKGVAPQSKYASSDFATALPDTLPYYQDLNIVTQNHSYGVGIQNYYGAHARAFDLSVNKLERLAHIFSSGNMGNTSATTGIYAGIPGFANLTGNMKMAKNILVVGAIDSFDVVPDLSSRGPAYDGRIKPDLVAFGEDGTSGSAALVSGASLLLQDQYKEITGKYLGSDLVRGLLINSADDVGSQGPDFISGFGKLNVYNALNSLKRNQFFRDTVVSNQQKEFLLTISGNIKTIKITLSWNDTAATPNATKALVNDLDLELYSESSGKTWLPLVLNPFPNQDSLSKPAIQKRDTLNNTEQIVLNYPQAGTYWIRVKAGEIQTTSQVFSIVYQVDTLNSFTWSYPTSTDALFAGKQQSVRWANSFPAGTLGSIEFTTDGGQSWGTINSNVNLASNQFSFLFPDTIVTARLRMVINNATFFSDSFPIAPLPDLRVGFVCDSVLLYWNKSFQHDNFRVYRMLNDSLHRVLETSADRYFVEAGGDTHFAVAPVIGEQEGIRSYTIDYTKQGVGCYINNFLADLSGNNQGKLTLQLGSLYQVKKVEILKSGQTVKTVFETTPVISRDFVLFDTSLQQGLNVYQAFVELDDGTRHSSEKEVIFFSNNKPYILFPNPVMRGSQLQVLVESSFGVSASIYDSKGMLVKRVVLEDKLNEIPTGDLGKGVYFMRVVQTDGQSNVYKFVVW